ncbi:transposase [Nonomuraea sp. NPDC049684]|uniref:transposase n=1 Tax=Nonomuraea sp. NPDC049684 TaxID=3364356 RepID=UPI0037B31279
MGSDGVIRTGARWQDVPACYGHWFTVYGLFRRWQREGIWSRILAALQACADAGSAPRPSRSCSGGRCRCCPCARSPSGGGWRSR